MSLHRRSLFFLPLLLGALRRTQADASSADSSKVVPLRSASAFDAPFMRAELVPGRALDVVARPGRGARGCRAELQYAGRRLGFLPAGDTALPHGVGAAHRQTAAVERIETNPLGRIVVFVRLRVERQDSSRI